jgi:hypothetical protein
MTYVAYGYGRDTDRIGSVVSYGLGIILIAPVINASINFDTSLSYEATKSLAIDRNIDFDLIADLDNLNQLAANAELLLNTNLNLSIFTQLNLNPNIEFKTNLDLDIVKELITSAQAGFDIELDEDLDTFVLKLVLRKQNVTIVEEELRFLPIYMELRSCTVTEDLRTNIINYENRTVIVLPSEGDK